MKPLSSKIKKMPILNAVRSEQITTFLYLFLLVFLTYFFSTCNHPHIKELDPSVKPKYAKAGSMLVAEVYGIMNAQLHHSMVEGDIQTSIMGCNLAITTIDSLAKNRNTTIKRVSHNNRNVKNCPTFNESAILKEFDEKGSEATKSKLKIIDDKVMFFSPIYMNSTCLKCHGEVGKTLDHNALEVLHTIYPEDKAIGYKDGDFGGMWAVTFLDEIH